MTGIADRLKYRLSSGLVVDMHMPPLETKVAILKKKAELHEEVLSDEIAHFIASCSVTNIRELEGFLIRVLAFASLTHQPLTLELAQKVLMRAKDVQKPGVSFERIVKCTGKYYCYDLNQLCSKDRSKKLTFARQVAMFLMKKITDKPLRDIGVFLGGRDHSTVMHALDKVTQHAHNNDEFQNQLRKIEEDILG
jgi:chromosomal replication initiator protein